MTTFKLFLNKIDITKMVANIKFSDSIDTLGAQLTFDVAREFYGHVELGDVVVFNINGITIFIGLIVSRNIQELTFECTCYDFAWYLNKSTVVKQYKNVKGDEVIKSICQEVGIKVKVQGAVAIIDTIYKDKTIIDVIKDVLDKSTQINGKRFNLEMDKDTLLINPFKKIIINPKYILSDETEIYINKNIGSINYNDSIDELKNAIIVISGDEKAARHIGEATDEQSIKKYGKIQNIVTLDAKDFSQANTIAKTKLKELNKINQNISLSLLGSSEIRAGRIIEFYNEKFKLSGNYLIKSSSHTFENGIHRVSINVEVFKDE